MGLGRVDSGTRGGRESGGALRLGGEDVEHQFVRVTDPHRSVAMISQRIARIWMEKNVQHAVIQRQPFNDNGKLCALESELVRPFWMRADRFLVEPAELQGIAETGRDLFAKLPGGVAGGGVEVDVGMPGLDGRGGEEGHGEVGLLAPVVGVGNLLPGAVVGLVWIFYYLDAHPARVSFNAELRTSLPLCDAHFRPATGPRPHAL
jgi:hypothetical protein